MKAFVIPRLTSAALFHVPLSNKETKRYIHKSCVFNTFGRLEKGEVIGSVTFAFKNAPCHSIVLGSEFLNESSPSESDVGTSLDGV